MAAATQPWIFREWLNMYFTCLTNNKYIIFVKHEIYAFNFSTLYCIGYRETDSETYDTLPLMEKITNNYLQLTSLVIMQVKRSIIIKPVINNHGNWTEWSAVWSEIIRLILKSHVWFEITSMISDQNCTTQSPITILLQPFWNRRIQSVPIFIWTSSWFVEKQKQKGF